MTQLIVTIDNSTSVPSLRKAIGMLKGVVSTSIYPAESKTAKRHAQETYVRESLTEAFRELDESRRTGHKLQTAEDFLAEISKES